MSSGTNQERIEQNNLKLAQLKTKADNLPEYQDVEPIYASDLQYKIMNTGVTGGTSGYTWGASYYGNYAYIHYNDRTYDSKYYYTIVKINDDGTIDTLIPAITKGGSKPGGFIISVKDNYLYYTYPPGSNSTKIRRVNLTTLEDEIYWTSYGLGNDWINGYYLEDSVIVTGTSSYTKYTLDLESKTIISSVAFSSTVILSDNYGLRDRKIVTNLVNNKTYTSNASDINFMSILGNKIIKNNTLYYINDNMVLLDKIKDMTSADNYVTGSLTISLANDLYVMITSPSVRGSTGYLCTFDDATNTFNRIYTLDRVCFSSQAQLSSLGRQLSFRNTSNEICYLIADGQDLTKIIGYKVYGRTFPFYDDINVQTDKVLQDYVVYNNQLVGVKGTMPNNGALNYTPSASAQTIPAGYTSGGTVAAVTSAIDSNIQAENIKKDITILGVTGTYVGSPMKEYTSTTAMNNDIANISEGEVVKVTESNVTTFYLKQTTMKKLVKEEDTISPAEYVQNEALTEDILGIGSHDGEAEEEEEELGE